MFSAVIPSLHRGCFSRQDPQWGSAPSLQVYERLSLPPCVRHQGRLGVQGGQKRGSITLTHFVPSTGILHTILYTMLKIKKLKGVACTFTQTQTVPRCYGGWRVSVDLLCKSSCKGQNISPSFRQADCSSCSAPQFFFNAIYLSLMPAGCFLSFWTVLFHSVQNKCAFSLADLQILRQFQCTTQSFIGGSGGVTPSLAAPIIRKPYK